MAIPLKSAKNQDGFLLSKWFLDCVTEDGQTLIFYAARLKWRRWEVPYTSWLRYTPGKGVSQLSRLHSIQLPVINGRSICWNDSRFAIEGNWEAAAAPLEARLAESGEGFLDWKCHQPAAVVNLRIKDQVIKGMGYAEQLVLTMDPWKIPMKELRWGRYSSPEDQLVWIELRGEEKQQWVWYNGEKIENASIEDDRIFLPSKDILLKLDRNTVLEAEKKLQQIIRKLTRYLPGFHKSIPWQFMMADEFKWLSRGILEKDGQAFSNGWAIHEFVNFNGHPV